MTPTPEFPIDPYGPSDEFDPTPQYEYPIRDLPDDVAPTVPQACEENYDSDEDYERDYEGQECPVCGYDLNRYGECTGNGCGADLSS